MGSYIRMLEAAHIFPFCSWGIPQTSAIWEVAVVRRRLNFYYHNINDIENVMILESTLHKFFGKFMIALEPTDVLNIYNILCNRRCSAHVSFAGC